MDAERAVVVGHDWGGAIAWTIAMTQPDMAEKLIICNLPHFKGLQRELARNPEQQKNSQYARNPQEPNAHLQLTVKVLAEWVTAPDTKTLYIDAFEKTDFEAMLNYIIKLTIHSLHIQKMTLPSSRSSVQC